MKGNGSDEMTVYVRKAIDILFIENRVGTSVGVLLGVVLKMAALALSGVVVQHRFQILADLSLVYFLALGVFVFNLRSALRRRPRLDPQIEAALAAIEVAKQQGNLSPAAVKLMYKALFDKVLERMTLDPVTQDKVEQIDRLSNR